jgi:uncharacterized protein YjbI with pentapeptide repeats
VLLRAVLDRADFGGADLTSAAFDDAVQKSDDRYLLGVKLRWANLSHASLRRCDLRRSSFRGTNLTLATLAGSQLTKADFDHAKLIEADLSGATLSKASFGGSISTISSRAVRLLS